MKKRWTAVVLALALAAALLPSPAFAAGGSASASDSPAGSRLTGVDRAIYDTLRTEVIRIANGARTSTSINVPDMDELTWSLEELGMSEFGQDDIVAHLKAAFNEAVHISLIYQCLSADLPYEMYWKSNKFSWGYTYSRWGDRISIKDLTVRLHVAEAYRGGSDTTVSAGKVAAAKAAEENARAIVAKYQDQPDYQKLQGYFQEICDLVSYNKQAAGDSSVPYGDPWQMVYVFDGDPTTNVVCEGYAKAFKYLCDLTDFDGDIHCLLVAGVMDGGNHMWNVVQMEDGKNYLVDVTNCDEGIGSPDKLFLCGGTVGSGGRAYSIVRERLHAIYSYKQDEWDLYTDGYLTLSAKDYVYTPAGSAAPPEEDPAAVSRFVDVDPGEYYASPVAWAVAREITAGTTDTTFSPNDPCTHAQILTFLWRAEGEPVAYEDVPLLAGSEYYMGAVLWATRKGMIVEGFDPDAPCDRLSAMVYIWQAFGSPNGGENHSGMFTDVSPAVMTPACETAVYWAVDQGVTDGTSETTFSPFDGCSRGQIVTFLYRAYANNKEAPSLLREGASFLFCAIPPFPGCGPRPG